MPDRIVSALSVALFGMFLAIIIPPVKENKIIGMLIIVCFASSFAFSRLQVFSSISGGTKTIILTVVISALAALIFPKNDNEEAENQ